MIMLSNTTIMRLLMDKNTTDITEDLNKEEIQVSKSISVSCLSIIPLQTSL